LTAVEHTDEDLLSAARTGDREALEALLLRYQAKVYGFGMRMCRDPEDAKDVLQDTLLAMARTVRDFRGASSISTWLYTIARSFCVKKRRRGRSVSTVAASIDTDKQVAAARLAHPSLGPEEQLEHREVEAVLARSIAELAPNYREVLVLRDIEGLSAPEVAEVLGITVDTVKSRLHRARLAVRDTLGPLLGVRRHASRHGPGQTCPDVMRLFSRHLEGEITADLCAEMERHLERCARCRDTCASLQRSLHICRTAPAPHVPEAVQQAIREQVHALVTNNS
jgi:RNA polymerase sigma-70 factor (ECF subfamily)